MRVNIEYVECLNEERAKINREVISEIDFYKAGKKLKRKTFKVVTFGQVIIKNTDIMNVMNEWLEKECIPVENIINVSEMFLPNNDKRFIIWYKGV